MSKVSPRSPITPLILPHIPSWAPYLPFRILGGPRSKRDSTYTHIEPCADPPLFSAPTHNLTLSRTAREIVKLDHKLHDAYPSVLRPALPIDSSALPQPVKRKFVILNTFSRLVSPTSKSTEARSPSAAGSSVPSTLPTPVVSPKAEIADPFFGDLGVVAVDTSTCANPTITGLAAYLTTLSNDQVFRQARSWKRFVRVRTDDLESVRVERAIRRVRSDVGAHFSSPSTVNATMHNPSVLDDTRHTVTECKSRDQVSDFETVCVLGKGRAGKVLFVLRHKSSLDLYALKVITKRHVLAHQELQQTLTEQAVLRRMAVERSNPFVVKLWWSFHDKENLYLLMVRVRQSKNSMVLMCTTDRTSILEAIWRHSSRIGVVLGVTESVSTPQKSLKVSRACMQQASFIVTLRQRTSLSRQTATLCSVTLAFRKSSLNEEASLSHQVPHQWQASHIG